MTIRFDIYDMTRRERVVAALTSLGFVEDPRRRYTFQIEPDKRLHAFFASDGLELHCDQTTKNKKHRNVSHELVRPTFDAIKAAVANLSAGAFP